MTDDNLLPGFGAGAWRAWSPREELRPAFERTERTAGIRGARFEQYGKWLCDAAGIEAGGTYRARAEYRAEGIAREAASLHGMLTWRGAGGEPLTRDYMMPGEPAPDGWKALGRAVEAPEGARSVTVELACKWTDGGAVEWRSPVLERTAPIRHRLVRVAAAFIDKSGTLEGNLAQMLQMLDRAGAEGADIVCLGETPYDWGVALPLAARAVAIPGPVTDALAERAQRHGMYVALSVNEKENGLYHNTGLLIDRRGGVAGKYRKMQLPLCEGEEGITPGRGFPVFDTDFGRVGMLICWDHAFPEAAGLLAAAGAELLLLPTLWHTELQARARAADNGVYVAVSAPRWAKTPCRVIDPQGDVVASIEGGEANACGICTATIDLDRRFYTYWCSVGAAYGEAKMCCRAERRADVYGAPCG